MPTYEYVCEACGHEFERFQKISERPIRRCPECGERKAQRRISSGGGIVFKGPGFYATDYRQGSPKKTGAEKGDAKGEGGEKGDGKKAKDAGPDGGAGSRPVAEGDGGTRPGERGGGEGA